MAPKDVFYHELLETLAAGGCALCRLGNRAADSYLDALIYEGVTDVKVREELRDARGLCRRHAWRMAHKRGSVLGTAIVYRDVINTLTRALEAYTPAGRRLFGRGQDGLTPTRDCPACQLEADALRRAAKTVLQHVDAAEVAAGYVAAGGLCLPHLQIVLGQASAAAAQQVTQWQAAAWRQLRGELDELIRKHDHRFGREPITAQEADAWERAVAAIVGAAGDAAE
jgi:hypothetical protein